MPLVGFISADGSSGPGLRDGKWYFADALAEAERPGSTAFPQPYPVLKGIMDANQDRGDYISVTSILHCARNEFLKRRESYFEAPEKLYAAWRGTMFHALLEKHKSEASLTEVKTIRNYKGVDIGGTYDSLRVYNDGEYTIVEDWKTTENLPKWGPYSTHVQQINLYRWLLGLDPKKVKLVITYFNMTGFVSLPLKDGSGPWRGGKAPTNQVWSDSQVEEFLDNRLFILRASLDTNIPMPYVKVAEDEKWLCDYCPVRQRCADLAVQENEATWRRRAGLPPLQGGDDNAANLSTEWHQIVSEVELRTKGASLYPAVPSVDGTEVPVGGAAKKRGRPRKEVAGV